MYKEPLISVFIPYYNDAKYLRDAIDAVIDQTYSNWELVLFNHASTDGSRDIAHSYNDKRIIHIDAEKNLGAGSGYNLELSLQYMHGDYVKLLCADDIMMNDCLETLVNYIKKHPEKDIVAADMCYIDENKRDLNTTWSKEIPKVDFVSDEKQTLLKFFQGYSHIAYPSTIVKKDALQSIKIDTSLIMLFDVWLWVNLLIAGKKIGFINKCIIKYRISDNQLSSAKNEKAIKIGFFELFMLLDSWLNIKDIELVKYLVPCHFARQLEKQDIDLIPFVISYFFATVLFCDKIEYFKDQQNVREIFGNYSLYRIMSNKEMRKKVYDKFEFDIKDFRAIYSFVHKDIGVPRYDAYKHKIYIKDALHLSLFNLLFLIIRKFYRFITYPIFFKKYNGYKKKKPYTI